MSPRFLQIVSVYQTQLVKLYGGNVVACRSWLVGDDLSLLLSSVSSSSTSHTASPLSNASWKARKTSGNDSRSAFKKVVSWILELGIEVLDVDSV